MRIYLNIYIYYRDPVITQDSAVNTISYYVRQNLDLEICKDMSENASPLRPQESLFDIMRESTA